jgi:hypothetical protein
MKLRDPSFAPLPLDAIEFLSERTGIDYGMIDFTAPWWLCVHTRDEEGVVVGVLVCEFKTSFDVHCSYAIDNPRCMTRRLLRAVFRTLFSRAVRVTSLIEPTNEHAISMARRMGFVYEGFLRMGVEGKRDALIYGMLAADCRFLPGHQSTNTSPPRAMMGEFHGLHS